MYGVLYCNDSSVIHMKKLLLLLVGLLLFVLLSYFCIYKFKAPAIQADIQDKVEKSLLRNNLQSIQVSTNGRDITLRGVVNSDALKAKAARVAAVDGYSSVDNEIEVVPEQIVPKAAIVEPYTLLLRLKNDQSIILSGSVSSAETKTKLLDLANSRYGKLHVTDDLSVRTKAPANWKDTAVVALNSFSRLKQGQVRLSNQEFFLTGVADSEESRQQIGEYLEGNLPKNYTGNLDIAIVSNDETIDDGNELSQKQQTENCQKEFKSLLSDNQILFGTGGAVITKSSFGLLDKLVLVAMGCPDKVIIVAGYTDSKGSSKNNKKLSEKRAQAVVNYLQEKGIGKKNLKAIGYGEEKPVATNRTPKGRALNRRIEFIVEGVE
jgi:OOP family OmpA-OmpF porin